MPEMTLKEAWLILGRDSDRVIATIKEQPREKRIEASRKILEKARRIAAKVSAQHHPDIGGDPIKFKRVWAAFNSIEFYTREFETKMIELQNKIDNRVGTFIELDK